MESSYRYLNSSSGTSQRWSLPNSFAGTITTSTTASTTPFIGNSDGFLMYSGKGNSYVK
jgi:hypothetical protein